MTPTFRELGVLRDLRVRYSQEYLVETDTSRAKNFLDISCQIQHTSPMSFIPSPAESRLQLLVDNQQRHIDSLNETLADVIAQRDAAIQEIEDLKAEIEDLKTEIEQLKAVRA